MNLDQISRSEIKGQGHVTKFWILYQCEMGQKNL